VTSVKRKDSEKRGHSIPLCLQPFEADVAEESPGVAKLIVNLKHSTAKPIEPA